MTGLGIDTGGTCTDAVIYDLDEQRVLCFAKTLTTKEALETGIENAVCMLDPDELAKAQFVSLSTTLATNACVEKRGGRVKLLFIGVKEELVRENYREYGFESMDDLRFIEGVPEGGYCSAVKPDWDKLKNMMDDFKDAQAIGIVQYFPEWNNAAFEKEARRIISEAYDVPIVCGSELFSELNAIRRGAGTYLNIRLIPIIREFLSAIGRVLEKYSLNIPVYIVRSDGTLMNEEFAKSHPVETLLCGPAASAMGGAWMAKGKDAMVVDIGGTTTDIAILKNGVPVTVNGGIKINGWKTFVKGLFIDTFGLGGDSAVRFDGKNVYLESFRILPAAMAAAKYPVIRQKLKDLKTEDKNTMEMAHEGFVLIKEPEDPGRCSQRQRDLCARLKAEPMLCREVISFTGISGYRQTIERLEKEGIILRFGLTPTDIMHVNGDYTCYDAEAARLALEHFAAQCFLKAEDVEDLVYEGFKKKLYKNIVRTKLEQEKDLYKDGLPEEVLDFIDSAAEGRFSEIETLFRIKDIIVGVGGPAHIFVPETAKKLGSGSYIHENAMVANAIGTLAGRICVTESLEISYGTDGETEGFRFYTDGEKMITENFEDAVNTARKYLIEITAQKARKRGAEGELAFESEIKEFCSAKGSRSLLLGGIVKVSACGNI